MTTPALRDAMMMWTTREEVRDQGMIYSRGDDVNVDTSVIELRAPLYKNENSLAAEVRVSVLSIGHLLDYPAVKPVKRLVEEQKMGGSAWLSGAIEGL